MNLNIVSAAKKNIQMNFTHIISYVPLIKFQSRKAVIFFNQKLLLLLYCDCCLLWAVKSKHNAQIT